MTTPGKSGGAAGGGQAPSPDGLDFRSIGEADDQAHYYFAPFEAFEFRGDQAYRVAYFPSHGLEHAMVDLRDPGSVTGFAFVRSATAPDTIRDVEGLSVDDDLPDGLVYVGQKILGNLTVAQRNKVRTVLGLRGQVTDVKSILRFMLLTEANQAGKPGRLQAEPDGGLYVYLGDLQVDLSAGT